MYSNCDVTVMFVCPICDVAVVIVHPACDITLSNNNISFILHSPDNHDNEQQPFSAFVSILIA